MIPVTDARLARARRAQLEHALDAECSSFWRWSVTVSGLVDACVIAEEGDA
jgi:hypothetical protein